MTEISQKRFYHRTLAICRVSDLDDNFLGLTLDLTIKGIHIIISKEFPDQERFSLVLHQGIEDEVDKPKINLKIAKVWRKSTNEEYDEIGGKIIEVDLEAQLKELIQHCDNKLQQQYQI